MKHKLFWIAVLGVMLMNLDVMGGGSTSPSPKSEGCRQADEYKRIIEKMIGQLKTETLPTSVNCDGPGGETSATSFVILPDFCGEYEVTFTVDANVETMNSGYDIVSVNGKVIGGGLNNLNDCGMTSIHPQTTITVRGGSVIDLTFSANDNLHHSGAMAAVNAKSVSAKLVKECNSDPSGFAPTSGPGTGVVTNDCVYVGLNMGRIDKDNPMGTIIIRHLLPSVDIFKRSGIIYGTNRKDVEIIIEDSANNLFFWDPNYPAFRSALNNSVSNPAKKFYRQIKTPLAFIDFVDVGEDAYEIRFYNLNQVSSAKNNGLYIPSGTPYTTWMISNPNVGQNYKKVFVSEETGDKSNEWLFTFDDTLGDWTLESEGGKRKEIRQTRVINAITENMYTIMNENDDVIYQEVWKAKTFPWGDEVLEKIVGTEFPLITTYTYYDNIITDGYNYGNLKQMLAHDGYWERYYYNANGEVIKKVSPFVNSLPDSAESECKVEETIISSTFPQRTKITKVQNSEISRSYFGEIKGYGYIEKHHIACSANGATWNDPDNIVSITRVLDNINSPFNGEIIFQINADGTGVMNSFELFSGFRRQTQYSGLFSNPYSDNRIIIDGQKTITDCDLKGNVLSKSVLDIKSNLVLYEIIINFDEQTRTQRIDYGDGTYEEIEFGCCSPEKKTDRDEIVTIYAYNSQNQLEFTEQNGIATLYNYDARGKEIQKTVRGKNGSEITSNKYYNTKGELIRSVDAMGNATLYEYTYDIDHGYAAVVNEPIGTKITKYNRDRSIAEISGSACVNPLKFVYTVEAGELVTKKISISNSGNEGEWEKVHYNLLNAPYKVSFPDDTYEVTEFDKFGRAVKITNSDGNAKLFAFNTQGFDSLEVVDLNNNGVIDYEDDMIRGYSTQVTIVDDKIVNQSTSTDFLPNANVVRSVIEESIDGRWRRYSAGGISRETQILSLGKGRKTITTVSSDGLTLTEDYMNNLLVQSVSNVDGRKLFTYDEFNRQRSVDYLENGYEKSIQFQYDLHNNITGITMTSDDDSEHITYVYDNMGRKISEISSLNATNYSYSPNGRIVSMWGDSSFPLEYEYDMQGRIVLLKTYNDFKQESFTTTQWSYNSRGLLAQKVYPDGSVISYTYNAAGKVVSMCDARSITKTFNYNNSGQLISIDYSDTTPDISFEYDRAGRVTSITDASGKRDFTYNEHNQVVTETIPYLDNMGVISIYDEYSRLSSLRMADSSDILYEVDYAFDNLGRVSSINSEASQATYSYGLMGQYVHGISITRADQAVLEMESNYDKWNNINQIKAVTSSGEFQYTYEYDNNNYRSRLTLPSDEFWLYEYDSRGQVTSGAKFMSDNTPIVGQKNIYAYDDIGNRKYTSQDIAAASLRWYTTNNLNQYKNWGSESVIPVTGRASTDALVTVKATNGNDSETYPVERTGEYFAVNIPIDVSRGPITTQVEVNAVRWDENANADLYKQIVRTHTAYPNSMNLLTYDANGNLMSFDGWSFCWNGENRLLSAEKDGYREEYSYDYAGRRWYRKCLTMSNDLWNITSETKFIYSGFKQIAEYNVLSDCVTRTYVWSTAGNDIPLWMTNNSNVYYYSCDANKNIRNLFAMNGNIVAEYDYDPFGKIISMSGDFASDNPYRFSSEYYNDVTGLVYYNYRYYSPILGRWLSRDPLEEKEETNLYLFVKNSSINYFDSLGLSAITATLYLMESDVIWNDVYASVTASKGYICDTYGFIVVELPASVNFSNVGTQTTAWGGSLALVGMIVTAPSGPGMTIGGGAGALVGGTIGYWNSDTVSFSGTYQVLIDCQCENGIFVGKLINHGWGSFSYDDGGEDEFYINMEINSVN